MLILPSSLDPRQSPNATTMYARRGAQIIARVFPHPSTVPQTGEWYDSPDKIPEPGNGRIVKGGGTLEPKKGR